MAVNQEGTGEASQQQPRAAQQQPATPGQTTTRQTLPESDQSVQSVVKSFRNPQSLFPRLGNRNLYSEYVAQLVLKLKETIGQLIDQSQYEYEVQPMPEESNLGIAVVLITVISKTNRKLGVAYFTLLLEKTASPLQQRVEQIPTNKGNIQVEVLRTTADRYNQSMRNVVETHLRRLHPNLKLISADGTRVPEDRNPDDKGAIQDLAIAAYFAAGTILTESDPAFRDINLHEVARDTQLQLRPHFASTIETSAIGEPIRSDISLELSAQSTTSNGILGEDSTSNLYKLNAFVDFLYFPQESAAVPFGQPALPSTQRYLPRVVITKAESSGPMSLGFNLLGLVQASALLARNAWMQTYLNRGSNVRDIQDVGYMNIEANVEQNQNGFGQFVDTQAGDFDEAKMQQYLSLFTRSDINPILSQDIPLFDPSTWYLSPLLAAATGNENAQRHLINVANQLTNNNFGKYFPKDGKFVVNTGEHIHLGYYIDQDGQRRDIRDVDLNAVLARQGHIDPKMGERWTETFLATDVPEPLRLSDRRKIIDGIVRGAVYTGYAVRISYHPQALAALAQGCKDAGLDVKNVLAYTNLTGATRHRAGLDAGMLQQAGSFNPAFLNQGAVVGGGSTWSGFNTANRWN